MVNESVGCPQAAKHCKHALARRAGAQAKTAVKAAAQHLGKAQLVLRAQAQRTFDDARPAPQAVYRSNVGQHHHSNLVTGDVQQNQVHAQTPQ